MEYYYLLFCMYLLSAIFLIRKKDIALTVFVLIYTGPVISIILRLLYPEIFFLGGGRLQLQTLDNTKQLFVIASFGMLGFSLSYMYPSKVALFTSEKLELNLSNIEVMIWMVVAFSLIYYIMPTIKLFHSGYHYSLAGQQEIPGLKVGRVIGHALFLITFVCVFRFKVPYRIVVTGIIGISVLYLEILSGVRVEGIGLFVAMMTYYVYITNSTKYRKPDFEKKRSHVYIYTILFVLIIILYVIDKIRTGGIIDFRNFATFDSVAASFLGGVQLIESGYMDFLYGQTYLDIFRQTLPASIYPERPLVPAQFILQSPFSASGGAYIAGTAYMNFGYFGPFIVLFLIGRLCQITKNGMLRGGLLSTIIYLSFVMSYFRLIYYSELSSYKMVIVGILALLTVWVVSIVLKSTNRNFTIQGPINR